MALRIPALALAGALAATTAFAAPARAAEQTAAPANAGSFAGAFAHSRFDPAADTADWRCRGWRCNRWGGGWGRGWRRNRIDAGDVLIGAAIIGGAIAIANSNNRRVRTRDVVVVRDNDWRETDWREDDRRFDDRRTLRRSTGASGLDNAVDQCLTRIERDVRVDSVDTVERTGRGWLVSGALFDGSPFQCRIGNDGRIDGVDFGRRFTGGDWGAAPADSYAPRADGQWSDQRYADARLAMGGMAQPQTGAPESVTAVDPAEAPFADAPMPAYPGGPIPGEDIPETIDGDISG